MVGRNKRLGVIREPVAAVMWASLNLQSTCARAREPWLEIHKVFHLAQPRELLAATYSRARLRELCKVSDAHVSTARGLRVIPNHSLRSAVAVRAGRLFAVAGGVGVVIS